MCIAFIFSGLGMLILNALSCARTIKDSPSGLFTFSSSCKSKRNRLFYGWKLIHVLWGATSETWVIEALAQVPCLSLLWFHYITHFNRDITQRAHVWVSEELLNNASELNGSKFNQVREQCVEETHQLRILGIKLTFSPSVVYCSFVLCRVRAIL